MLKSLSLNIFLEEKGKLIAVFLLILMFTLEIMSAAQESQIIDEGVHLAAGYSYLKNHKIELNPEHPPLIKLLSGLMISPLKPNFPWQSLANENQWNIAGQFFYDLGNLPETMLFFGRLPIMLFSLLLGWLIFIWAKNISGVKTGLFALLLFVFDSNILAHSRYITTDIGISLGFIATLFFFCQYIKNPKTSNLFIFVIIFALTQVIKFSALLLWPMVLIPLLFSKLTSRQKIITILGMCLATFWVIFVVYFGGIDQYYVGLKALADHEKGGHYTYLMGNYDVNGFKYYFPIAFLVKTPLAFLILLIMAAAIFIYWQIKEKNIEKFQDLFYKFSLEKIIIIFFPIFYFIVSIINTINIGIRHLLPIYPFLFIFTATVIFNPKLKNKIVKVFFLLLLLFFIIESIIIYPNYLGYFSLLIGGPSQGYKYLLDSNLDWGQDLKKLKKYLDENNISEPVYLDYFGKSSPDYYQINYLPLNPNIKKGFIVISVQSLLSEDKTYKWLLNEKPLKIIGSSIYLYHL